MMSIKVYIRTPYSTDRNLGAIYNEEMSRIPNGHTACFIDGDCCFLTPDYGHILAEYANKYPDAVLTCWTNRIHELAKGQRMQYFSLKEEVRNSMIQNIMQANVLASNKEKTATPLTGPVSGFLLVIPKHIWQEHPFSETNTYRPGEPNLLGCDNEWTNRIRKAGVEVLRIDNMLVWHSYRLLSNGQDKTHLL